MSAPQPQQPALDYRVDPCAFCDEFLRLNEQGRPWRLSAYQRRALTLALTFDESGLLTTRLLVWGEMKKSGKTMLAACLATWWAMTRGPCEVVCLANDLEQSQGRVFATVLQLMKHNGFDRANIAKLLTSEIRCKNGSVIKAVASDYRGEAGGRQTLSVFDEIWAFDSERATRLWEEHQPIPTVAEGWVLVVTTAGFTGESKVLENLCARGLAGERIDPDLELYRTGAAVTFWSRTRRQPWQIGEAGALYYAEQRTVLRPATFQRLHENTWVSSESAFITGELWDGCVESGLRPLHTSDEPVWVGLDIALKHDGTGCVGVQWQGDGRLRLVFHRIWPAPVDLAAVERFLLSLHERFPIHVVTDPFQALRTIAILRDEGLDITEMPQTMSATTAMGEVLFELLTHRQLRLYPASDLRTQALATTAVEHARGMRIGKDGRFQEDRRDLRTRHGLRGRCESGGRGCGSAQAAVHGSTGDPAGRGRSPRSSTTGALDAVGANAGGTHRGDEERFDVTADALEAHLMAVERDDPCMAIRLRAVVDRVAATAEALDVA